MSGHIKRTNVQKFWRTHIYFAREARTCKPWSKSPKKQSKNITQFPTINSFWEWFGKLVGRTSSVLWSSPLLEINTKLGATKLKFIVDNGASISIIPAVAVKRITWKPTPVSLSTANGERIKCFRQANLEIGIPSLRRSFTWAFVSADITNPLLGLDFLYKFGLIIDCRSKTIHDPTTTQKRTLKLSTSSVNFVVNEMEVPSFVRNTINKKYPDLITPHKNHYNVYHRIDIGSHTPGYAKARQPSVENYDAAYAEFKMFQNDSVISPSERKWSSPLHMAAKQNGEYRCCGDYRSLNSITKSDQYPIPNISSFSEN